MVNVTGDNTSEVIVHFLTKSDQLTITIAYDHVNKLLLRVCVTLIPNMTSFKEHSIELIMVPNCTT